MSDFTPSQQRAIFIAPIITGAISVLSAAAVAVYVLLSKERRRNGYHRIILAISGHILIQATALCFSSGPVPSFMKSSIYGASGTVATCEIQGFVLFSTTFAMILYYSCIPLFIFSRLRANFTVTRKSRLVEICIHLFCNIIPFTFAVIALSENDINPVLGGAFCGLNVYPHGCLQSPFGDGSKMCVRGNHTFEDIFQGSAVIRMLAFALAVTALLMIIMRRGCDNAEMKTVAILQASVHFFALLIFAAIGLLAYCTSMKYKEDDPPYGRYVGIIILWSCSGIIHLIAYFVLRSTWIGPLPKLHTESNNFAPDQSNPSSLVEGTFTQASKRWSLSAAGQMRKGDWYKPFTHRKFTRWSFSFGERERPRLSTERDLEQMQRLRVLSNMKLEPGSSCSTNQTIFDGTNPSKRWSAFILPNDIDYDEADEDEEAKYYSDICQQEM